MITIARQVNKDKIREEIRKEWIADGCTDFTDEELNQAVEWEYNDRVNGKNYVESEDTPKKKREYNVKLDKEKVQMILHLENLIKDTFDNVEIINPQQEICFDYNNSIYSFKLSKHTNKWKKPTISDKVQKQFDEIKESINNE